MEIGNKAAFFEPMSPRLRLILFGLGFLTIFGLGIWFTPRGLGFYYQIRGGLLLDQVFSSGDDIAGKIACELTPIADENARLKVVHAVDSLRKSIHYNENEARTSLLLGRAYCLLGETEKAIDAYRSHIGIRQEDLLGHLELGFAYEAKGSESLAVEEWLAADLAPSDFFDIGEDERRNGHLEQAIKWYHRADLMQVPYAKAYVLYTNALIHEGRGEWELSINSFERAAVKASDYGVLSGSAYYRIGMIQQDSLKNWDDALDSYDTAVVFGNFLSDQDRADTFYRRGIIFKYGYGDSDRAIQEFYLALEAWSNHYGALLELGWSYWEVEKDFKLAEQTLQTAIRLNPEAKWGYVVLGDLYQASGMLDKALVMYESALDKYPNDEEVQRKIEEIR